MNRRPTLPLLVLLTLAIGALFLLNLLLGTVHIPTRSV